MRNLIARLTSTSTPVILSALALGACDSDGAAPADDASPVVAVAALASGASVGWTFDVTVESVRGEYPEFLDISIPVDFEARVPARAPRSSMKGAASIAASRNAPAPTRGEVRLVDAASGHVVATTPIVETAPGRAEAAWVEVHLYNPCLGRHLCDRPFRLEVDWQGPTPVTATADLTDAIDAARDHVAVRAR
ncbi:MAG: hypothetical protein U1F43_01280 [Myxococcota bacterium]